MADPVTLTMAAGAGIAGVGTLIGGEAKARGMEDEAALAQSGAAFRATQLEGAASESLAAAQRQAFEKQRLGKLALSTLTARAAAGGGGAADADVIRLGGDIAGRSTYEALGDLFTGQNRAAGLLDEAASTRYSAAAKAYGAKTAARGTRIGSYFSAGGTILKGAGTMAGKASPDGGTADYG